jgi:hypothetical protein
VTSSLFLSLSMSLWAELTEERWYSDVDDSKVWVSIVWYIWSSTTFRLYCPSSLFWGDINYLRLSGTLWVFSDALSSWSSYYITKDGCYLIETAFLDMPFNACWETPTDPRCCPYSLSVKWFPWRKVVSGDDSLACMCLLYLTGGGLISASFAYCEALTLLTTFLIKSTWSLELATYKVVAFDV